MTGASNALAREFLTDVHRLCSEVARLAEEDEAEGEDSDVHMVAMWSYLLQGRGFLLLRTLDLVIDQDLSCREELLTLLLSLLPLIWSIPVLEEMPQGFPLSSIPEYSNSDGYSMLLRSGKGKVVSEEHNSGRQSSSRRKSRYHRCSARFASPTQISTSDSDGKSSSQTLGSGGKYSHPSGHVSRLTCFQEPLKSLQPKSSAKETTSTLDAVQPGQHLLGPHYLSSEIPKDHATIPAFSSVAKSPFDLCQVLLSLLGKVYKFGTSFRHTPSVMVTLVPSLIEMLIDFGDDCSRHKLAGVGREVAQGWTEEPIALVQRMLLRAILHLMMIDIAQGEAMSDHLFRNLTRLLQATLKIHSYMKKVDPISPSPDFSRYQHCVLLLSELLEGLLHVLLGYLQASTSNPAIFSKVLQLLHGFVESQGLRLLEASALQLESFAGQDSATSEKALEQVRDLVGVLLSVIAAVKKAASEQLHQSICHRRRHRRCEYTRLYHHHNITGLPGLALGHDDCSDLFDQKLMQDRDALHPGPGCCVAACAHQCLHLLEILPSKNSVCLQILTGLQAAGVCCCMDPRSVLVPLLHAFQAPGLLPYQSHVLNILSRLLLEQLGGGQLSKTGRQAACSICTLDDRQLLLMEKIMQGICASGLHIPTDIPDGVRARDVLWRWDALEAYRDLMFDKDRQQGLLIAGHVCSLLLQGNSLVQGLLYTHVFSPVLQRGVGLANYSRELCISSASDQSHSFHCQGLSVEVLSVFLQALPSLLKHRVIRNLFLSSNGLHQVTELIHLDPVRTFTLRVFETLILHTGNQQANPASGMRLETEEVTSFHSHKEDVQGLKLGKAHQNGRAESDACRNDAHLSASSLFLRMAFLCVSKEADSDRDSANDSEDTSGYDSTASEPLGGRLPCLPPDDVTLPAKDQLWRVADVWSACHWIYRSSHTFQKQLFKLGGFDICSRLMTLVIQKLATKTKDSRGKKKKDAKGKPSPGQQDSHDPDPGPGSNQAFPSGEQTESKCQEQVRKLEEEWPFQCLRLLEALLAICLQGAGSTLQKVDLESSFQPQSKQETLHDLQEQLSLSGLVASDLAIPLFDCLLRVALAEGSPSPDVAVGKAERKLQSRRGAAAPDGYQSEEASDSQDPPDQVTAEEGYEGDAESHTEDSSTWDQAVGADAGSSEEGSSWGPTESPGLCELRNPEVCSMQLALLASGSPDLGVLTHVLRGMLQALRGNPRNVTLLYRQGAVKTLLNGFQHILSRADPSYEECQTMLVELLVAMASKSVTQEELVLLVRLFLEKAPPVDVLLGGFLRVVKANVNPEPLCFLKFPLAAEDSPGLIGQSGGPRESTRRGHLPLGCLAADGESPGRFGASPWHMAPIHLQLMGQNCWPHLADGFSVSLWLRTWCDTKGRGPSKSESHVRKPGVPRDLTVDMREGKNLPGSVQLSPQSTSDHLVKDGFLHIFSMGSKALMLQVWANPTTGAFSFRVCVDPGDEVGLLAKAESQGGLLTPGQWEHIALTYTQKPEGKRNAHGRLALWICGVRRYDVSLDYPLPRKPSLSTDGNKTYCMLGHRHPTVEDQCGTGRTWDFGSLLLFNGSRIESEEAFYLYASGPDFTSIMPVKYGKPDPRLTKYASEEGLQADPRVLGLLTKGSQVDTTPLAESLAVVYTASRPGSYAIYEPVVRLKGQPKVVASTRPFSTKDVQSPLVEAQAIRALRPTEPQGLQRVLHQIGGTGTFVFLFAKTVELSDREETQALALKVLLSLIWLNQHRVAEMERCHGYSLVRQVLVKPKCIVGYHMLQTLLDGCCSSPILSLGVDGRFHLDRESTAVVQDLHLLSSLLLDWKVWSKAQAGVWAALLEAMEVLIHARHPQQMYNIQQLLKARVVQRILLTCQVLQDEHLAPIPQNVCASFVKIIQEVLGSPPDLELLRIVYGFLLAAHPPADAYVCHAPSAFCFSLHIDGKVYQEKVQSLMFQRQFSDGARSASGSLSPTGFAGEPLGDYFGDCQTSGPHHQDHSPSPSPCPSPAAEDKVAPPDLEPVPNDLDAEQDPAAGGLLLSSCESAVTVVDCHVDPPEMGRREEPEADWEGRDIGVGGAAEALLRPDSLLGVRPIPKGNRSGFAGLHLTFPAQNIAAGQWPGTADRNALHDDATAYSVSAETACNEADPADNRAPVLCLGRPGAEDRLAMVCCGLYELLRGVLLTLPDIMLEKVVNGLIQPEALIVLVNHPSALVQQAVIKLLDAYFSRAFQEQKERFLKNHGFSLLANQLYLRPGSQGLLECCLEMVMGRPVGLEEELDPEALEKVGPFQKRCVISLLGLIESSLGDSGLVHAALCTLLQLLNACPKLTDILLDHGLLCVLLNTLAALNGLESGIPLDDHKLLVCDIQQLLVFVTIHSCSSSGSQYFRIIEDLVALLGHLQTSTIPRTKEMAVILQFQILQSAIRLIRTTADRDPQRTTCLGAQPAIQQHTIQQRPRSFAARRRLSLAPLELLTRMRSVASEELSHMIKRRMGQESPVHASEAEFSQRLQRLLLLAVNLLIYQGVRQDLFDLLNIPDSPVPQHAPSDPTEPGAPWTPGIMGSFQKEIFELLMEGLRTGLGGLGRGGAPRQQWARILWSCRDTFRAQFVRLLAHALNPARPLDERKRALGFVYKSGRPDVLREAVSLSPELALYLCEMLYHHRDSLTQEDQASISNLLVSPKYSAPPGTGSETDLSVAFREDLLRFESEKKASRVAWEKKTESAQRSLMQRLDAKLKEISRVAADVTQAVSQQQSAERKKVMQHIRSLCKLSLTASRHWQWLVQQLTHDRAVWYDPASYPTSWQLDPTEGPNRERRRLQRCYMTVPNKYLLKERRKCEDPVRPPLSFLFEDRTHSYVSSTVKDKATSEPTRSTMKCFSVAPSRETPGDLLLGKSGMYFVEDHATDTPDSHSPHGETEPASFSWTYEEIKEVHKCWWQLRDNALEIFLTNGRTLLLAFDNTKARDNMYHNILTSDLPNLLEHGNITALTQLWGSGLISNFEYLTHLNKHAGRSFNDLMQYPVFPFILNDYASMTLDLQDPSIYRNLGKPIAVQSKEKEDRYIDNYKYLEEEFVKGVRDDDPVPPVQPYHYGSHYSNSGTVLHFLVRMPPFTKMFLAYQDQSFDIPDRTFHSMNTTWRLSSYESMTDVKELIPEFFYLPEFLVNREGFDFGVRQNSERVNHVNLPPWARNDPRLFVLIHRQALESDQVSQTLCQWIDLVFGFKQKGKAAVQAVNVFHPATYFGMDVSAVEDPVQRRALETMIKTYGQTPRQLFSTSHVSRDAELPAAMGLLVHLAFRENREHGKEPTCPSPLPWIKGLKWGEYVGSPSAPDPVVCFSQPHGECFGSLLALPTRAICGLSRKFCLMMIYSKEQGVRSMRSTDIRWSAILSWGYADHMLRLKSRQSEPPVSFLQCSPLYQVTSCAWVPDSCQLFTGTKCGAITVYASRFSCSPPLEVEVESQVQLYGHTEEVTGLFVCKPFSILISVSKDGTCILWDLNRLCYVQSLTGHKSPVVAVSASETTGDIATACNSVGGGSDLRLWTVNGDLIGHVHCREIICSMAFSNQPEGISVNVIAGGLENGVVRLWSTWDLKPVREITFPKSNKPIVSLTFSCDGHHLYMANSEGTVIAWCRRDQQRLKLPMFYSFLSSYAIG
ncbi:lysosomal-trafficking regulator-like isoform X2 [Brienomyrus brachyistius]|uniref:lysosomal-trafficking regulator-like isoform X2 n=1 Tax=Brienomyrus brachyistius TaxID=42636 RepID=UPI0020B21C4E|nr:lysosomal-trafficking regulator-like isoform X2 [Brienomyrus brachyistius]XP_048843337.1 lysosomal-trafficking regulator-like isoform X2 [Brienomyrus brachyistius]XP_048843338.1 lysosomal-trafficking regulator-like isoform X2 [Brienomyrus brachyistius]XP_048843339.1 lysosomal-trafficking regulator-like isoform X2 [Brienomyrus brachyistius]XP_048843340.1 lysosomal-trafficking regulator-like isoform X2 [Brienomyrus brachyistius]XP_048843341.1 lysosomal-trafficking regulator-like isoform X2 [B